MIAVEDLQPNCTFEDNCGHLFVLRSFSVRVDIGRDGTRYAKGTATLERLGPNSNEQPLTLKVPIDGVSLLRKIADHDLSAPATVAAELGLTDLAAA